MNGVKVPNKELRKAIVKLVYEGKDGHIPSGLSIIDIVDYLYKAVLKYDPNRPDWEERDYFILSKGHGCTALYVVLEKYGFITKKDLSTFCRKGGILGEHPDCTKIPGVEASTGSLGHGFPFGVGIALGLKIQKRPNKVFVLVGDGECHEGTVWESANIAANQKLNNLFVIVDWNKSAAQLMPIEDMEGRWKAFGWDVTVIDGHDIGQIKSAFSTVIDKSREMTRPSVILAHTVKGKGVPFMEGHGLWHHRIPNEEEYSQIMDILK